jgi:phospholipid/cholesterol/gamma-HCH transport system permease protein
LTLREQTSIFLIETGNLARFTGRFFSEAFKPRYEFGELLRQSYIIGNKSLSLVGVTAFILGLVLTIQLRPPLLEYGAESTLPYIVGESIIREIGPVIIALIFAGKIGSSIGAELGSMKVTEQIDAMEVSGTNPFKYLVVTRITAATLMLPLLVIMGDGIALFGSYLGVNIKGSISFKLFFFGFAVGLVGCYKGYYSSKGTEGVGKSANSAVVVSSFLVFLLDLIAVQITDLLGLN